jgi:prepilin-type N-terminal cleavage/methylation domain-containing protein
MPEYTLVYIPALGFNRGMVSMTNQKAFTLVEAVVTAAIVAILAAIAIPMYAGFIHDQRQTTVNNLAETAAASANAYLRRTGADPTVAQLNLYYDATKYTVTVDGAANTVTIKESANAAIIATKNY